MVSTLSTTEKIPKVSILVVTYNSGEYISSSLQSVLDQEFGNFELLILDNGSSDGTPERIRHFTDSRIQLYQSQENLGAYEGLNYLLSLAKGDYIAIQDHDDLWHPEKLKRQISYLEKHTDMLGCGCSMIMYYESDGKYFEYFLGNISDYALHPSVVYRNLPGLRYDTSVTYMADAHFLKNILSEGCKKIANIPDPLALHLIKDSLENYSYRWFRLNITCIRRLVNVHGFTPYMFAAFGFELQRKMLYPSLNYFGARQLISRIERLPFVLLSYKIHKVLNPEQNLYLKAYHSYLFDNRNIQTNSRSPRH